GFTDWVEQVADSKNARDYRSRVSDAESASMWQSLSYGANYKSAYCLAVCPAGEDVIGPYLADRKTHLKEIVRPLQEKEETIYVTKNSDAEDHVAKRFPHKKIKHVGNSLRPNTIEVFLKGMPNVFQPGKSAGLNATFHFTFTGREQRQATVVIQEQKIGVKEWHVVQPDLHVTADWHTRPGLLPSYGETIPPEYRPGQCVSLHVAPQVIPIKRSYTVAPTPTWRDRIEITVKREGQGLVSRWLHDAPKIWDEVDIEPPNGCFT